MLTPKQVAERIGVSDSLVYEWCAEGLLPHYRVGRKGKRGKVLIEQADLDAFLTNCRHEAKPPVPLLKHIRIHG
jgi:excisionase family DNA binding protein